MISICGYGAMAVMNEDFLDMDLIKVPEAYGYFNMKDLFLGYFDNYIALGITPLFKKYNASDIN